MFKPKIGIKSDPNIAGLQGSPGLFRLPPRGHGFKNSPVISMRVATATNQAGDDRTTDERAQKAIETITHYAIGGDCWSADPQKRLNGQGIDLSTAAPYILIAGDLPDNIPPSEEKKAISRLMAACRLLSHRALLFIPDRPIAPLLELARAKGWPILCGRYDPWPLLVHAKTTHSLGGDIGFLALLCGHAVHCYGSAPYTGHGLTQDHIDLVQAPTPLTRHQVVARILFDSTRYIDPFNRLDTQFETIAHQMADWRRLERQNQKITVCCGMSFWKRPRIKAFLASRHSPPAFIDNADEAVRRAVKSNGAIAVWASREPDTLRLKAEKAGVDIIRIEDGFIRSVGLGADFTPPASITLDTRGLYFDPACQSDLEVILADHQFTPELCDRAAALAHLMISRNITKYAAEESVALSRPIGKKVIFVPGQVEDDRSIICGGAQIRHNFALLSAARASNPDAFILYKPHPDVDAGHRIGAIPDEEALRYADRLERGTPTTALLSIADEVHVITSLVGFEALLRCKKTVVYGQPFYAGWGLTEDKAPISRRTRRLTREELIAGVLILFPRYIDPMTMLPCSPETLIERLGDPSLWYPTLLTRLRRVQGKVSRFFAKKVPAPHLLTMRQ